jgi:Ca2+-binding RTX toxin-like protein
MRRAGKMSDLTGTSCNDTLTATDGDDTISGLAGDDSISGGTGNDSLLGGAGNDTLTTAADGNDTVDGGEGIDIFLEPANYTTKEWRPYDPSSDFVIGILLGGASVLISNVEILEAPDGSETGLILGTEASESLSAVLSFGSNWFYAGYGNDTITGGSGNDLIESMDGNDSVNCGNGNGTVYAGNGDDTINGGAGNDYIEGEDGNDTVVFSGTYSAYTINLNAAGCGTIVGLSLQL